MQVAGAGRPAEPGLCSTAAASRPARLQAWGPGGGRPVQPRRSNPGPCGWAGALLLLRAEAGKVSREFSPHQWKEGVTEKRPRAQGGLPASPWRPSAPLGGMRQAAELPAALSVFPGRGATGPVFCRKQALCLPAACLSKWPRGRRQQQGHSRARPPPAGPAPGAPLVLDGAPGSRGSSRPGTPVVQASEAFATLGLAEAGGVCSAEGRGELRQACAEGHPCPRPGCAHPGGRLMAPTCGPAAGATGQSPNTLCGSASPTCCLPVGPERWASLSRARGRLWACYLPSMGSTERGSGAPSSPLPWAPPALAAVLGSLWTQPRGGLPAPTSCRLSRNGTGWYPGGGGPRQTSENWARPPSAR